MGQERRQTRDKRQQGMVVDVNLRSPRSCFTLGSRVAGHLRKVCHQATMTPAHFRNWSVLADVIAFKLFVFALVILTSEWHDWAENEGNRAARPRLSNQASPKRRMPKRVSFGTKESGRSMS